MTRPRMTTDSRFTFDVLRADAAVLVDFHADGPHREPRPMTVDSGRPGHLELARRVVQLVGEFLTVAVVARSLDSARRPATMERTPRNQEIRCAATR